MLRVKSDIKIVLRVLTKVIGRSVKFVIGVLKIRQCNLDGEINEDLLQ